MGIHAECHEALIGMRVHDFSIAVAVACALAFCGCASLKQSQAVAQATAVEFTIPDPGKHSHPHRASYEIVRLARDPGMEFAYCFGLHVRGRHDFKALSALQDDLSRKILGDYLKTYAVNDREARFVDFPEFVDDCGVVTGKAVVMSIFSNVEMEYNADSGTGRLKLRFNNAVGTDAAREWARRSIEAIVRDKNVRIRTGEKPPEGEYYSLGEVWRDNVLEIEFKAEN